MSDAPDCLECKHADYCEHTSMLYCDIEMQPAWMSHNKFFDYEKGECSKKESHGHAGEA